MRKAQFLLKKKRDLKEQQHRGKYFNTKTDAGCFLDVY